MQTKIKNLISQTTDTLKDFASGNISINNAVEIYNQLNADYEKLITDLKKTGYGQNNIEDICYYHNIENFSIYTGIFKADKRDFYSIAYYGEQAINDKIINSGIIAVDKIEENKILKITPDEEKDMMHNIYIWPLGTLKNRMFLLSLSSSLYFSEEKFTFTGRLLQNILNNYYNEGNTICSDYFRTISDQVESYIKSNQNFSIRATIYVFNSLIKIFGHTGLRSLFDISEKIIQTLKKYIKHNAVFFTLSLKDYLVLERIKTDTKQEKSKAAKPEFIFNNINIPYQSLKLDVKKDEPVDILWDKISVFENYLKTGDIIK